MQRLRCVLRGLPKITASPAKRPNASEAPSSGDCAFSCEDGYYVGSSHGQVVATPCRGCPSGHYGAPGCESCPAGWFEDAAAETNVSKRYSAGHFEAEEAQAACVDCGAGTFDAETGDIDSSGGAISMRRWQVQRCC